ncbi:hypothetical protein DV737_g3941, partial [Chaetothyriales sp. CBS 132003]
MTSTSLDPSLVDFAQYVSRVCVRAESIAQLTLHRSLDLSQVPNKFRCTACNNFLINAYKFGCCDVKFCYEASAGTSCPQCGMKLNPGICEPAASTRKSIKAWLRTEKDKARSEQAKSTAGDPTPSAEENADTVAANGDSQASEEAGAEPAGPAMAERDVRRSVDEVEHVDESLDDDGGDPQSDPTDPGDDDIEIQVEPTAEEQEWFDQQRRAAEEQQEQYDEQSQKQQREVDTPPTQQQQSDDSSKQPHPDLTSNVNFNNIGMDMMQQMQQIMASGMNPMAMMGMPMGMNPMAMFGGINGMNGMNMGMNFNPNQMSQMFGFQNNNMWQNSNSNAFSNGMGGDFQYGFNSNQQQYYSNDDFQAYRARAYGHDHQDLAEFAPGGQDEIQDALGDEYHAKKAPAPASADPLPTNDADPDQLQPDRGDQLAGTVDPMPIEKSEPEAPSEETVAHSSAAVSERAVESERGPIAEAYEEDLGHAMPPPSAPSGPSAMREPREPASKPAPRPLSNGGGISILGRASRETARLPDRTRSPPSNGHDDQRDQEKSTRRQSRREEEAKYDAEREDYGRERRHKKSSRRDDYDDYAMDEDDHSQDRRSSHKSRREREKYSTSTKHQSSHSRRHRDEPEDGYDTNDYGEPVRGHTKRRREHEATLEVNGRSNSHRSSEVPTPTSATPTAETSTDPYAAEREARIRERQLKEQQRRDNAKSSKQSTSGFGRRVSYKYEDEAERGMLESERAVSAARWR